MQKTSLNTVMLTKIKHWQIYVLVFVLIGCQPEKKPIPVEDNVKDLQTLIGKDKQLAAANAQEAIAKARIAWQAGKTDLAQALYIKAYDYEPDNVQLLEEMAKAYRVLDKNDLAEVCYRLILKKQPKNLAILQSYGLLLIKQKKLPEARDTLQQVVLLDSNNWIAYNGLGVISDIQNDHPLAQDYFKRALVVKANEPEILNNLGYSYYMAHDLAAAQDYYLQALKFNPDFKKATYNYGLLEARKRNYPEALAIFGKLVSPAEAHNNTGYIAMVNGDYAEADYYFNQALKLSPRFYAKANENLKELEMRKASAIGK